jgi:hypothetical protein
MAEGDMAAVVRGGDGDDIERRWRGGFESKECGHNRGLHSSSFVITSTV